jgi:uncharacterized repeat protein (TIGR01451 family)
MQTSNGSNAAPAVATLTVSAPSAVTLGKAFIPATINVGGISTLTITLSNAGAVATLTAPLTDNLPSGVLVSGVATTTCSGTPSTTASTVTLTGGSIQAKSSCTVTVDVTAPTAGSYFNALAAGSLKTDLGNNASPAVATLTVTLITLPAPGLSLSKAANPKTYTQVGQVIDYTYVLTNNGNVPLMGPFKVTDDKLGTFTCGSATTLAPGGSVSCTKSYTIKASDLGGEAGLPTKVIANINTGPWLQTAMSTQDTKISGAGPIVPNGIYAAWCIEDHVPNDLHNQPATLYSTIGGSLPADVASQPWNEVNYVLNHKIHASGTTTLQFFEDVQTAIWLLIGDTHTDFPVTANATKMINAAKANPGFKPGPGDVVAVIIYSDGIQRHPKPGSIQESIFEMKEHELKSIVNQAKGLGNFGGVAVQSGQAQATVNQTE